MVLKIWYFGEIVTVLIFLKEYIALFIIPFLVDNKLKLHKHTPMCTKTLRATYFLCEGILDIQNNYMFHRRKDGVTRAQRLASTVYTTQEM